MKNAVNMASQKQPKEMTGKTRTRRSNELRGYRKLGICSLEVVLITWLMKTHRYCRNVVIEVSK